MPSSGQTKKAHTLEDYRQALGGLESQADRSMFSATVLRALHCRDRVARILQTESALAEPWLPELLRLDAHLRDSAAFIETRIGRDTLAQWRDAMHPQATAWWWFLDERAEAAVQLRDGVLLLAAGLAVAFSLSIAADVCSRFLREGPDTWGVLSSGVQLFLTFLAGSAFVTAGRQWLSGLYHRVRLPRGVHALISLVLGLLALGFALVLSHMLPWASERYYETGLGGLVEHKGHAISYAMAMKSYRLAIALNPDNERAHFGLGNAYKDVLDYDHAIVEYQRVIEIDSNHAGANDQLALCLLLKGNDYDRALEIISRVFPVNDKDASTRYAAYKNRGWALWGLKRYRLAEADLKQALEARPHGAEAHAILAEVLEDEGRRKQAFPHWQTAATPAPGDHITAKWLSLAVLRVTEDGTR